MDSKGFYQQENASLKSYSDWQFTKAILDSYLGKCNRVLRSSSETEMREFLELLREAHSNEKVAQKKHLSTIRKWNEQLLASPNLLKDFQAIDIVYPD